MKRTVANYPRHLRSPSVRLAAACVEPLYALGMSVRNMAFDRGWRRSHKASIPVISVGNLTTGGTGKTPMVAYVAHTLQSYGSNPAVILRGYRRDDKGLSDEQELLRDLLPGTPILANPDRIAAAKEIETDHAETDAIILDDGFQHRGLRRDLDLVLIDATNPWGYGHVLPRGMMRERAAGLRRADAVVVTHSDLIDEEVQRVLDGEIEKRHGRPPIAHAAHTWSRVVDGRDEPVNRSKARVFVVAGIGNPEAFLDQAAQRFVIAGTKLLPDHAGYDRAILRDVRKELGRDGVDAVLTTEKDWVKLRRLLESDPLPIPVWRPRLCIAFLDGEKALGRLLLTAVKRQEKK